MDWVTGSFSAISSIVRSNRFPLSSRGAKHLWSSWTALHSIPGGVPEHMAHLWRPVASAIVSSCLTIWTSQMPWNSVRWRKSFHPNTPKGEWSTSCSFLVGWLAAWRPRLTNWLVPWCKCYWRAHPWSCEWNGIPSTSQVPFCSSQCRTGSNH